MGVQPLIPSNSEAQISPLSASNPSTDYQDQSVNTSKEDKGFNNSTSENSTSEKTGGKEAKSEETDTDSSDGAPSDYKDAEEFKSGDGAEDLFPSSTGFPSSSDEKDEGAEKDAAKDDEDPFKKKQKLRPYTQ